MLRYLNKEGTVAIMCGNVSGEVKTYEASNGNKKLAFGICVKYGKERTSEYANIECWHPFSQILDGISKGDQIFVMANRREYTGKDGQTKYTWTAEFATVAQGVHRAPQMPQSAPQGSLNDAQDVTDQDDDLPF